ncbi:Uncharacterised protein [Burkholderia pseudomallei]|nr:Uncharacterised protein [Burkholderia pseudomallei]
MSGLNGWKNMETFAVVNFMGSDPEDVSYWTARTQKAIARAKGNREQATALLARDMAEIHEETAPHLDAMHAELLRVALRAVDWHAIAACLIQASTPAPVKVNAAKANGVRKH